MRRESGPPTGRRRPLQGPEQSIAESPRVLDVRGLSVAVRSDLGQSELVRGVDLHVGVGETLGLVGESGSGKTVTSLAVMGLLPANARSEGSVQLNGTELLGLSSRAMNRLRGADVGMIFQEPRRSLNPAFTVGDQIAESVRRHTGVSRKGAWARVLELFDLVGISDAARRSHDYPHQFSGGMCQRVMLAMALACRPKLLIADEPTTALDVTVQRQVLQLIHSLQVEMDLALLLVTHDLGVVAEMCDRASVMRDGQVVETGTVADIFDHPTHEYTKTLLRSRKLSPRRTRSQPEGERETVLRVQSLRKSFGVTGTLLGPRSRESRVAVADVSLSIARGETFAVVGESGAGKSTLGRMVLRLIEPDQGSIELLGRDLASLPRADMRKARSRATMIFQDPYKSLDPKMQIIAALSEPMVAQGGYSYADRMRRISALMDRVGLSAAFLDRYTYEMSGGQLQRVAIARALVTDPDLVVCDEPVAALDMSLRAAVVDLLRDLQVERGMAYLFISHDLSLVRAISDRVAVMRHGEVVEVGDCERLFADPQHEYTRSLLQAVPASHPGGRHFREAPVPGIGHGEGRRDM